MGIGKLAKSSKTQEHSDQLKYLLDFYDKDPILVYILSFGLIFTPIVLMWIRHKTVEAREQTKRQKHILAYKLKLAEKRERAKTND